MAGIIKAAHTGERVRPLPHFAQAPLVVTSPEEIERERLQNQVAVLEGELAGACERLEDLREASIEAVAIAREEGRAQGKGEAESADVDRTAAIAAAAEAAHQLLGTRLSDLDRLAAALARDALERVFGDTNLYAELIGQILATELSKIDRASLVGIEVSASDFSEATLAELSQRLSAHRVEVKMCADLVAGSCEMAFQLGRVKLGPSQQWDGLRDLLDDMARNGA